MKEGFRLLEFSLKEFMLEHDIHVKFSNANAQLNTEAFSCALIIGENGCGKSELLVNLLKVLMELDEFKRINKITTSKSRLRYNLKYYLNECIYEIEHDKEYLLKRNGESINISEIELPSSFIAQSFSFADKFNSNSVGRYSYLGTRTASNVSYVSHIQNRIVEIVCTKINHEGFDEFLRNLLAFLNCDEVIDIGFEINKKRRFEEIFSDFKIFIDEYENVMLNRRISSDIKKFFLNLDADYIFHKLNVIINKYYDGHYEDIKYKIDIFKQDKHIGLYEFYSFMRLLSYMKILSTPKINFYKYQFQFTIDSASSGEKQMLYSLLNIYSAIKPNALIVIDEPEISLHPNWQMKYIKLLENMFYRYKSSHFIIASHSHFMVSDLEKENSSVIVMKKDFKNYSAVTYEASTYGWSAEDILYNVFSVPSSRNYYIAADVEEVIEAIANDNITEDIKKKITNFKRIVTNFKNVDPLKTIIEKILERNIV